MGTGVGSLLGLPVALLVGVVVGQAVGLPVGLCVGYGVGRCVGLDVGALAGASVTGEIVSSSRVGLDVGKSRPLESETVFSYLKGISVG